MNEDFVTYELAVKLKEKGFNEPCYKYYQKGVLDSDGYWNRYNRGTADRCSAPTISQVLKWLRKEKKIFVSILPVATFSTIDKVAFYFLIEYNSTGEAMTSIEQNIYCAEWNDAALDGISYVLNNLI